MSKNKHHRLADQKPKKKKWNPDYANAYVKYSALAFEMLAAMGLGVWIGYELDEWLKPGFPVFLIAFALLSFGLSLYLVIKSLPKY